MRLRDRVPFRRVAVHTRGWCGEKQRKTAVLCPGCNSFVYKVSSPPYHVGGNQFLLKEVTMYFMNICTWSPKDERELVKRREGWKWPADVRVVCEFVDLQGCRTINVVDTDAKGLIASRAAWIDVVHFETFPVFPFGEGKQLLQRKDK